MDSQIASENTKLIQNFIPSLYSVLQELEERILRNFHIKPELERYDSLVYIWSLIRANMLGVEQEFRRICNEEWEFLDRVDNGLVCSHTIAVVTSAYLHQQFKELDENDKSVVMWGCFFHDIAKRGPPEMKTKDPIHPFTSASKALRVFNRLGWVPISQEVENTITLINTSYFRQTWGQFMDNSKLPEIFRKLLYVTGVILTESEPFESYFKLTQHKEKSVLFVYEILAIILLHQSIDFDRQFPNFTPLKNYEILSYMSPRLLHLLKLLNFGDSGSYNLPEPVLTWRLFKESESQTNKLTNLFK